MSRRDGRESAARLLEVHAKENFVPLYAAFHSPVLSSATDQVSSFFANLSSELRYANAFHDNSNQTSAPHVSDHAAFLHLRHANGSFIAVTDAPVVPWSTLAPAGFHGLHCEKGSLTNWFGVLIQFVLGIVAFSSLVLKRYLEPTFERRPWIIWVFDSSKQVVGTIFTHFFNLAIATIPSGSYADPCFWYMFNYALDCTVGLFTMWTGLSLLDYLMKWFGFTDYRLGDYGKIERFRLWAIQCFLYCLVQIFEKLVVFGAMMLAVSTISFQWLERMTINPLLETTLALLIVPFFVNVIWFWIVDNLLMRSRRLQQRDSEDTAPYNVDAFVAPPSSSLSNIEEDAVIVTTNSSGGTSGIGTNSISNSPNSLRRSARVNERRHSASAIQRAAGNNSSSGVPVHVHAGSVRYGKPEVDRNRWGEADTLLSSLCKPKYRNYFPSTSIEDDYYAVEDAVVDVDDLRLILMRPPCKNNSRAAAANTTINNNCQNATHRGEAGDTAAYLSRHSANKNFITGAVTVHNQLNSTAAAGDGTAATNLAFNNNDADDDDGVMIVSESSSAVDDDADGIRVVTTNSPDHHITNALIDIGDDQQLVAARSDENRTRRKHSNSIEDLNSSQPMPAVRKHDNWRQQTPSTTSSSYPGDRQQLLLADDVIDAVEIVPGATSIDADHVVSNIFGDNNVNRI